jgi:hypothetical protein
VRIIKSHIFSHNIDFLKACWPDCPIILVHRPDDACLGWWVKCGHFNITYPKYDKYYVDLRTMANIISEQNQDILDAYWHREGKEPATNHELAKILGIESPPLQYAQDYATNDIRVKVI